MKTIEYIKQFVFLAFVTYDGEETLMSSILYAKNRAEAYDGLLKYANQHGIILSSKCIFKELKIENGKVAFSESPEGNPGILRSDYKVISI